MRRGLVAVAVAVAMAAGTFAVAGAADWPAKPVRIVSPFAPGGTSDTLARLLAEQLTDKFGQNFFVENLTGASGVVGTGTAANSPGDGHTILFVTNDFAVAPTVSSKVPYDAVKSFAPVTIAAA